MTSYPKPLAEGRWKQAALVAASGLGQAGAMAAAAFATRDAFAALHSGSGPSRETILLLIIAGILGGISIILGGRFAERLGQNYTIALRARLYQHIAGFSRTDLENKRLGGLSLRFVGDMSAAREWAGQGVATLVSAAVVLPSAFLTLWILEPLLAQIILFIMSSCAFVGIFSVLKLPGLHRILRSKRGALAVNSIERIAMAPELDLAGRTPQEVASLSSQGAELADLATRRAKHFEALKAIPGIGAGISGAVCLAVAAQNGIAAATIAASLALLSIVALPLSAIATAFNAYCGWAIAKEKLDTVFAMPSHPRTTAGNLGGVGVSINFDGVSDGSRVIDIAPGCMTILPPMDLQDSRRIMLRLAGIEQCDDTVSVAYSAQNPNVAYIGSSALILRGSLRRALTLGATSRPSGKAVRDLARAFGLRDALKRIGYRGRVESLGKNLSRKEQIGVDLTRAAVLKPDIIIVDADDIWAFDDAGTWLDFLHKTTGATIVLHAKRQYGHQPMKL